MVRSGHVFYSPSFACDFFEVGKAHKPLYFPAPPAEISGYLPGLSCDFFEGGKVQKPCDFTALDGPPSRNSTAAARFGFWISSQVFNNQGQKFADSF